MPNSSDIPNLDNLAVSAPGGNPEASEVALPVDKDWLVDLLNEKCQAKGALKGYQCESIGEGKGFLSFVTRVHLEWDQDSGQDYIVNLPKSLVVKKPTTARLPPVEGGLWFRFEQLMDYHNRECRAYTYLNKHSPPPIPMARIFYSKEIQIEEGEGVIILEDLTEQARSLTFDEEATIEQIMAIAGHIARLQAYGVLNPDYVDYVQPIGVGPFEEMFKGLDQGLDLARDLYPGKFPYTNDEFHKLYDNRSSMFPMFGAPTKVFPFKQVISLGDVQPNNILWKRGGPKDNKATSEVAAFLDFQIFHLGNCMNDIANPMSFGLSTEVRRANSDAIIDHYLACFEEALKESDHSVPITKAEAKRIQLELMFQYGTMGLCMFPMFETVMASIITKEIKDKFFYRCLACIQDSLEELGKLNY